MLKEEVKLQINPAFKNLMPPLSTEEKEALRKSIANEGVRDPVIVDENGTILDGHNRYEINPDAPRKTLSGLSEGEKLAFIIRCNTVRRNLSPAQKKNLLKTNKEIAKRLREENPKKNTQEVVAALLGVAQSTVAMWNLFPTTNINIDISCRKILPYHSPDSRVRIPAKEKPVILEMAIAGITQEQIAADYGVTQQQISKIIASEYAKQERIQQIKNIAQTSKNMPSGIVLLEGDMMEKLDEIKDNSIDLLLIDPPYGVLERDWDTKTGADYINLFKEWIDKIKPKLKSEHIGFIFADARNMYLVAQALELTYQIKNTLIWIRKNMAQGRVVKNRFISSYEVIFYFGTKNLNLSDHWSDERFDSFEYAVPQSNFKDTKLHPTQKPLDLFKRLVSLGSKEGEVVLDCFAGSGTTGVACKELHRNCILIEKDTNYIEIIKERLSS